LYAKDISRGGLFISSNNPVPVGTTLRIRVDLPGGHNLMLAARVAHVLSLDRCVVEGMTPGMGVQFLDLDNKKLRQIEALMEIARLGVNKGEKDGEQAKQPSATRASSPSTRDRSRDLSARFPSAQALLDTLETEPGIDAPVRPPPGAGHPPNMASTPAEPAEKVRQRLRQKLEETQGKDGYALLGLKPHAGGRAVRRAFVELSRLYHPNRFSQYRNEEITRLSKALFALCRNAYLELGEVTSFHQAGADATDPEGEQRPEQPEQTAPVPPAPSPPEDQARKSSLEVEALFADMDLQADQSGAKSITPEWQIADTSAVNSESRMSAQWRIVAVDPDAEDASSQSTKLCISEALRHINHKRYEDATRQLREALSIDPGNARAKALMHLILARLHKLKGETRQAIQNYQTVLDLDGSLTEAVEEVRAYHVSLRDAKGLFSKLFKK